MATKSVYTNTLAQIAGKISTALISIFLIKILTNYLDIEGYGLYSKIYNYLSIFSVIADLGLYTLSVREMSKNIENPEKVERISGTLLSLRTLLGGAIIVTSLTLACFLPGYNSTLALVGILITGVFTLFGLLNSAILSVLQAYLKTEFSFISVTVGKVANFMLVLAIVWIFLPKPHTGIVIAGMDAENLAFWAILGAGLLGNIVMTGLLYGYSKKIAHIKFHWDIEYVVRLLKESLPYGLALFFNVLFFKIDVVLLSLLEAPAVADSVVALYSLPMKIVEVGMMFGTVFLNSMLPLFTQSIGNPEKLEKLVKKAYTILFFFGGASALFLTLKSEAVLRLIASEKYLIPIDRYSSVEALQVVSFIFFLFFTSSLFTYLLIAKGRQSRLLWINGAIAIFNIIGNVILIPHYSFIGSSWATLASQVLLLVCTTWASRDIIKFNFAPRATIGILVSFVVAGFAVWEVSNTIHYLGGWITLIGSDGLGLSTTFLRPSILNVVDLAVSGIVFCIPALAGFWVVRNK